MIWIPGSVLHRGKHMGAGSVEAVRRKLQAWPQRLAAYFAAACTRAPRRQVISSSQLSASMNCAQRR
jgi:hypothetical protein